MRVLITSCVIALAASPAWASGSCGCECGHWIDDCVPGDCARHMCEEHGKYCHGAGASEAAPAVVRRPRPTPPSVDRARIEEQESRQRASLDEQLESVGRRAGKISTPASVPVPVAPERDPDFQRKRDAGAAQLMGPDDDSPQASAARAKGIATVVIRSRAEHAAMQRKADVVAQERMLKNAEEIRRRNEAPDQRFASASLSVVSRLSSAWQALTRRFWSLLGRRAGQAAQEEVLDHAKDAAREHVRGAKGLIDRADDTAGLRDKAKEGILRIGEKSVEDALRAAGAKDDEPYDAGQREGRKFSDGAVDEVSGHIKEQVEKGLKHE